MQHRDLVPLRDQAAGHLVRPDLHPAKNDDAIVFCVIQQRMQEIEFLRARHRIQVVGHGLGR